MSIIKNEGNTGNHAKYHPEMFPRQEAPAPGTSIRFADRNIHLPTEVREGIVFERNGELLVYIEKHNFTCRIHRVSCWETMHDKTMVLPENPPEPPPRRATKWMAKGSDK